MPFEYPAYVGLLESGELARRVEAAVASLADCELCARQCHVDRLHEATAEGKPPDASEGDSPIFAARKSGQSPARKSGQPPGYCRGARLACVSSCGPHHGEEDCLRGWCGSGTIFFTHCSLRCVFCQNFDISHEGHGRSVGPDELADMMLDLQGRGCHNINFVTPSHYVPQMLEGLLLAAQQGLRLPIVYNTGGYDRVETLRLLDGVVDIYMPDLKFSDPAVAKDLANAPDYPEVARRAIREMHRQVGDLVIDDRGLARRGLLVRHLVMPGALEETRQILRFLAREISADTFVNVMPQYHPAGLASRYPSISRPLRRDEYQRALEIAAEEGLRRLDHRS